MVTNNKKPTIKKRDNKKKAQAEYTDRIYEQIQNYSATDIWKRPSLERIIDIRTPKKTMLLVCEGLKTEPNYFRAIIDAMKLPVDIKIAKAQGDPLSVVNVAVAGCGKYDEVWAVIDRDSFLPERLHRAFDTALETGVKMAFSNEAFELWFILHFKFEVTGRSRKLYARELKTLIGKSYRKNDCTTFASLRDRLPCAMQHASKLAKEFRSMYDHKLIDTNPYTGVHHLINSMMPEILESPSVERTEKEKEFLMIKNAYSVN
jgi:hypothetical protein